MSSNTFRSTWKTVQGFLRKIINNRIYCIINVIIILFNLFVMSDGKYDKHYVPKNSLEFILQSDLVFTIFFIVESFISILADGLKKSLKSFWGLFNIFIFFSSISTLCGLTNLSPFRLWIILKYLSRIPMLNDIEMILKALRKSFGVLRDIAVFALFLFICAGIVGVSLWGGKFKYRCINSEGEFYDEDLVCSINPNSGYQCPKNFTCKKVDSNPAYDTMGFDNIIQAWLTIFQILTTEGWSDIMINGINSTNYGSIFYFLIIIMFGNWLLLQLIVATVTSNLETSIEKKQLIENEKNNDITSDNDNTKNIIDKKDDNDKKSLKDDHINLETVKNVNDENTQDISSEKSIMLYNTETNNPTSQTVIGTDIDDQSIRTVSVQNISIDNSYSLIKNPIDNTSENNSEIQSIKSKSDKSKAEPENISLLRKKLMKVFLNIYFDYFVLLVTMIDVIALCSSHKDSTQEFLNVTHIISVICTIIFGIEMILKLYAFGIKGYVSSYFNIFDGLITIASYIEFLLPNVQGMLVLRVIRAMRILRISKFSKSLVDLAVIIKDSSKQLLSLAVIWIVSVVIFSAICIQIFSGDMNFDDGIPRANFDTMGNAVLSVIQLYTVENWNDIEVSVARSKNKVYILVLIAIIIIGAFILSQILVAILLSAFTEKIKQDMEEMKKQHNGKQAKFTIKRAFNDLFENVKEKNISNNLTYNSSSLIDGDDKFSKTSSNSKRLKLKKRSFDENMKIKNEKNGNNKKREMIKNNSEPSLFNTKKSENDHHILSNKNSFSQSDLKKKNMECHKMDYYQDNNSENYNHLKHVHDHYNKGYTASSNSNSTKYANSHNEIESFDSSSAFRKNLNHYFNDDSTSLNSSNYSTPVSPNSPTNSHKMINSDESNESGFKHIYHNYRDSNFVRNVQILSNNKVYLFFVYLFIITSCITLIFDSPNQKNQNILNTLRYLDIFYSIVFCIELFINLVDKGAFIGRKAYLRSFVNWIDVLVIVISIMSAFRIAEGVHAFRVLRVFRVFRLVKLHEGMRIVFMAIWKTIPSLATALIPYLFFLIITSAMGLSMFVGEGWQCNDDSVKNKAECVGYYSYDNGTNILREERIWEKYELGYDNILDSIQTSLVITNQEGWPDIMYRYIDSVGIDQQPVRDNRPGASIFYILSVLIGNWIFLAVVTGITFDSMKRNQDILKGLHHLTDGQRKLLDYIALIISYKPKPPPGVKKRSKIQQRLYDFFKSNTYEYIAFCVVLINIFIMVFARYDATDIEVKIQVISEYIFTAIYIVEVVLLIYAYKPKYFLYSRWNILNLIITIFAVISIAFDLFSQPNYLSVFRLLRIIRLVKFAKGLKALASAILFNFAQLMNVTLLMFITCYIFAIIGMHSFGDIDYNKAHALNEHLNFSTFRKSLLTVFVFSTGENWPVAMTDCSGRNLHHCDPAVENCGEVWAPAYFILLEIIFNWILLNSFIAITVDTFLNVLNDLEEINRIETITNAFRQVWLKYDMKGKGVVEFKDMLKIYRDFHVPNNYLWGGHNNGVKPSIQKLFRTVIVYNNKCTYADSLMSILNSWIGEQLPDDVKLKYWRRKNYDRIYRSSRNTPMNNSLVMPSDEYYSRIRKQKHSLEKKNKKDNLNKRSISYPSVSNLNTISEDITETGTTFSNYNRNDTNYHVRPNLRKTDFKRIKTNFDYKNSVSNCSTPINSQMTSTANKCKYNDMESESNSFPCSSIDSFNMKTYEEATIDMPKYAVPLSTHSSYGSSNTTPTSSNTPISTPTPISTITTMKNNSLDSLNLNSKFNKGKTSEPESMKMYNNNNNNNNNNEQEGNNNIHNNKSAVTSKKSPMFRIDSFNDDSSINNNNANSKVNNNNNYDTIVGNSNLNSSVNNTLVKNNIGKSGLNVNTNLALNTNSTSSTTSSIIINKESDDNNQKPATRIDSKNLDITFEINKRINRIFKNKNSPSNINNYNIKLSDNSLNDTRILSNSSDVQSSITDSLEKPVNGNTNTKNGKAYKAKKYTSRVSSSIRYIFKPYSKEEDAEEDKTFDVTKDVLQFYVVYAIYRVQIKYKKSRTKKIQNEDKIEVITNN